MLVIGETQRLTAVARELQPQQRLEIAANVAAERCASPPAAQRPSVPALRVLATNTFRLSPPICA